MSSTKQKQGKTRTKKMYRKIKKAMPEPTAAEIELDRLCAERRRLWAIADQARASKVKMPAPERDKLAEDIVNIFCLIVHWTGRVEGEEDGANLTCAELMEFDETFYRYRDTPRPFKPEDFANEVRASSAWSNGWEKVIWKRLKANKTNPGDFEADHYLHGWLWGVWAVCEKMFGLRKEA